MNTASVSQSSQGIRSESVENNKRPGDLLQKGKLEALDPYRSRFATFKSADLPGKFEPLSNVQHKQSLTKKDISDAVGVLQSKDVRDRFITQEESLTSQFKNFFSRLLGREQKPSTVPQKSRQDSFLGIEYGANPRDNLLDLKVNRNKTEATFTTQHTTALTDNPETKGTMALTPPPSGFIYWLTKQSVVRSFLSTVAPEWWRTKGSPEAKQKIAIDSIRNQAKQMTADMSRFDGSVNLKSRELATFLVDAMLTPHGSREAKDIIDHLALLLDENLIGAEFVTEGERNAIAKAQNLVKDGKPLSNLNPTEQDNLRSAIELLDRLDKEGDLKGKDLYDPKQVETLPPLERGRALNQMLKRDLKKGVEDTVTTKQMPMGISIPVVDKSRGTKIDKLIGFMNRLRDPESTYAQMARGQSVMRGILPVTMMVSQKDMVEYLTDRLLANVPEDAVEHRNYWERAATAIYEGMIIGASGQLKEALKLNEEANATGDARDFVTKKQEELKTLQGQIWSCSSGLSDSLQVASTGLLRDPKKAEQVFSEARTNHKQFGEKLEQLRKEVSENTKKLHLSDDAQDILLKNIDVLKNENDKALKSLEIVADLYKPSSEVHKSLQGIDGESKSSFAAKENRTQIKARFESALKSLTEVSSQFAGKSKELTPEHWDFVSNSLLRMEDQIQKNYGAQSTILDAEQFIATLPNEGFFSAEEVEKNYDLIMQGLNARLMETEESGGRDGFGITEKGNTENREALKQRLLETKNAVKSAYENFKTAQRSSDAMFAHTNEYLEKEPSSLNDALKMLRKFSGVFTDQAYELQRTAESFSYSLDEPVELRKPSNRYQRFETEIISHALGLKLDILGEIPEDAGISKERADELLSLVGESLPDDKFVVPLREAIGKRAEEGKISPFQALDQLFEGIGLNSRDPEKLFTTVSQCFGSRTDSFQNGIDAFVQLADPKDQPALKQKWIKNEVSSSLDLARENKGVRMMLAELVPGCDLGTNAGFLEALRTVAEKNPSEVDALMGEKPSTAFERLVSGFKELQSEGWDANSVDNQEVARQLHKLGTSLAGRSEDITGWQRSRARIALDKMLVNLGRGEGGIDQLGSGQLDESLRKLVGSDGVEQTKELKDVAGLITKTESLLDDYDQEVSRQMALAKAPLSDLRFEMTDEDYDTLMEKIDPKSDKYNQRAFESVLDFGVVMRSRKDLMEHAVTGYDSRRKELEENLSKEGKEKASQLRVDDYTGLLNQTLDRARGLRFFSPKTLAPETVGDGTPLLVREEMVKKYVDLHDSAMLGLHIGGSSYGARTVVANLLQEAGRYKEENKITETEISKYRSKESRLFETPVESLNRLASNGGFKRGLLAYEGLLALKMEQVYRSASVEQRKEFERLIEARNELVGKAKTADRTNALRCAIFAEWEASGLSFSEFVQKSSEEPKILSNIGGRLENWGFDPSFKFDGDSSQIGWTTELRLALEDAAKDPSGTIEKWQKEAGEFKGKLEELYNDFELTLKDVMTNIEKYSELKRQEHLSVTKELRASLGSVESSNRVAVSNPETAKPELVQNLAARAFNQCIDQYISSLQKNSANKEKLSGLKEQFALEIKEMDDWDSMRNAAAKLLSDARKIVMTDQGFTEQVKSKGLKDVPPSLKTSAEILEQVESDTGRINEIASLHEAIQFEVAMDSVISEQAPELRPKVPLTASLFGDQGAPKGSAALPGFFNREATWLRQSGESIPESASMSFAIGFAIGKLDSKRPVDENPKSWTREEAVGETLGVLLSISQLVEKLDRIAPSDPQAAIIKGTLKELVKLAEVRISDLRNRGSDSMTVRQKATMVESMRHRLVEDAPNFLSDLNKRLV